MTPRGLASYYVVLSAVGAALVVAVAVLGPEAGPAPPRDRALVAAAFLLVCALGLSAAVRPNWIRRRMERRSHDSGGTPASPRTFRGHHQDCPHFAAHVLTVRGRVVCAGCTGLGAGAVLAASLMAAHAGLPGGLPLGPSAAVLALGLGFVALNYLEAGAVRGGAMVHVTSNVLLVLGFLLLVAGTLEATGDAAYAGLAVVVSLLMVDTRIQLSRWRHSEIRKACGDACGTA